MSKQFIEGNIYVFTKKKLIKEFGKKTYKENKSWIDKINGRKVTIIDKSNGSVGSFAINPDWCRCIKNNNPKIESESI